MGKKKRNRINIPADPPAGPSLLWIAILLVVAPPVSSVIGLYLGYKRLRLAWKRKRYQMFRRYANAIGERGTVSIRELAAHLGMTNDTAVSDLQEMIDEGIIGGSAYIDRSHMTLYLDTDVIEAEFDEPQGERVASPVVNVYVSPEDRARTVAEAQAKNRRAQPAETKPAPAPQPEVKAPRQAQPHVTGTESENFEAKLKEIRQLNDEIENGPVSERIDRIGELTASIFRVVREKPERAEEVRKFMNYYLPTTLKLLKSYSLMEKQSYQGENIQASRKKIEEVLDTLVHAFEEQQDRLFRTEALDVETDISVLETMMSSDGLVQKDRLRPRAAGAGEGKN